MENNKNLSDIDAIKQNANQVPDKKEQKKEAIEISREIAAHLDGLEDFYELRKKWSSFIMWCCIAPILIFHMLLTIAIGLNWLNFREYPWFVSIASVEGLIQVIGLALIIVKFLFHKKDNNALS